jgi:cysteine desulfurase/selenocysteine lyase
MRPDVHDSPAPAFDVEAIRREFPILRRTVNGRPLVYLDNAATSQKPLCVIDAVRDYYTRLNANVHRGIHRLSQEATDAYEEARRKVARFIGAGDEREVVFVRGATEAINLVAHGFVEPRLREGDEVLVTGMEHHSNIVPWQIVCARHGAKLRHVPIDDRGAISIADVERMATPRTKFVSVVWVSNALGTINPVADIIRIAHARGIPVLVDACQAVQHLAVDVRALGCDFLAFSGHKTYAPTGIGALWGRMDRLEEMEPWQGGGDMIRTVSFEGSTWNGIPARFEAGTPHIEGAIGLGAAIDWMARIGIGEIEKHEARLLEYGTRRLLAVPGLRMIGTAPQKASVMSFVVEGTHATDLGALVDQEGVAVRVGHHCAQPVMDRFGVPGTLRASLAAFNTEADIDALVRALEKALAISRGAKAQAASPAAPPAPAGDGSIAAAMDAVVAEFSRYESWEDRYEAIIAAGEALAPFPAEHKTDANIVKGCQSVVHMHSELDGTRMRLYGTSDAAIVRGLIALLLRVYDNRTPTEVLATPPAFIQRLGLNENLTQGRANGLASMIEQIRLYALAFQRVAALRQAQATA